MVGASPLTNLCCTHWHMHDSKVVHLHFTIIIHDHTCMRVVMLELDSSFNFGQKRMV